MANSAISFVSAQTQGNTTLIKYNSTFKKVNKISPPKKTWKSINKFVDNNSTIINSKQDDAFNKIVVQAWAPAKSFVRGGQTQEKAPHNEKNVAKRPLHGEKGPPYCEKILGDFPGG